MPFKGTDKNAYRKASIGKTPRERRKLYYKFKKQNEGGGILSLLFGKTKDRAKGVNPSRVRTERGMILTQRQKPVKKLKTKHRPQTVYQSNTYCKQTLLDDIRDYKSSKFVSCVADGLAKFVVKCGGQEWDNTTKNKVRSAIALVAAEVINKAFEEPLKIVENIELFIKVGKTVYKVIVWIDETVKQLRIDYSDVRDISNEDPEYIVFSGKYSIPNVD